MKKGDILYCHNSGEMHLFLTVGKKYKIREIRNMKINLPLKHDAYLIILKNDLGGTNYFTMDDFSNGSNQNKNPEIKNISHYRNYFYTAKELRKYKLKVLNESR